MIRHICIACLFALVPLAALGDDDPPSVPAPVVTEHEVVIAGHTIKYEASAGYMLLPDYEGKPTAKVFHVAYRRLGVDDPSTRPITFAFNGGPGSSSVWLHLGALGPRRVWMDDEGNAPPPPYRLVDNDQSWLDLTDLVFIDPVSTGYSRPVEGEDARQFHGLEEDIRSVGEFIRLYLTKHQRWASPKFLAGESYGTTRSAGLAAYLQDQDGIFLNGIVLISPVLNFQTIRFASGNDMPYWMFLPTYTATAFYHGRLKGRLGEDLQRTLREVEQWARTEYLQALALGDELPADERDKIVERLASYTGLSTDFVDRSNLRINIAEFTKELLRDQRRTVGRLDSRFKGIDASQTANRTEHDPSMTEITGPYTAMLNDYIRRELGYQNDLTYEILTGRVQPWSYAGDQNRYVNVAERLRSAMSKNPDLHVLFCSGYYDLATPYFAMQYTVSHMGLDPEIRPNISGKHYQAGHMMYIRRSELEKLKADVSAFYHSAGG